MENNPDFSPLVVAISSRALFDMDESHRVYLERGVDEYSKYQRDNEDVPLSPGEGFNLVTKLLAVNSELADEPRKVEVILLSRNSGDTGLRVFNSIKHYNLDIVRAGFCGGVDPWRYVKAFKCHLFLSQNSDDVKNALDEGVPAATMFCAKMNKSNHSSSQENTPNVAVTPHQSELRFAFDGDSVIFNDTAEQIYQQQGLQQFNQHEASRVHEELGGGPFKPFLAALQKLQIQFHGGECPIRTALVTARSAPSHERVIRTLRNWSIRIDESLFLGGLNKAEFLRAYGADVFFDDQVQNCEDASDYVSTAHVPHGISNQGNSATIAPKSHSRSTANPYAHWRNGR